jgi:flagellar biosynthesis component FlhA
MLGLLCLMHAIWSLLLLILRLTGSRNFRKTKQNKKKTKQNKTKQNKTKQNKTKQNKTKQINRKYYKILENIIKY